MPPIAPAHSAAMRSMLDSFMEPNFLIGLLIGAQLTFWTLAPAFTHWAPPLDVVESYMWGREWVVATFKHPSMPGWVLELSYLLTGAYGWPAYLVSQLFIVATFAFVFLLGRDLMGPEKAAAGTLLLTGIAYFAWWTPELKHNIAETPFWAGLPWLLWRAVERRSIVWWALAGAFAGLGMYARLTVALLVATASIWMLVDKRARQSLTTPGPWIGLVLFLLACVPLARWLVDNNFQPLIYASERAARSDSVISFVVTSALNLSGVAVMLLLARLFPWPGRSQAAADAVDQAGSEPYRRALTLLLVFTVAPLAFAITGALVAGGGLKAGWGNALFNFVGLIAVFLTSHRFTRHSLKAIAIAAFTLVTVTPLGYALAIGAGPRLTGLAARVHWPQQEIAERMSARWKRDTGRPLGIVTGDSWIAGLVGLTAEGRPSILNRGDLKLSPWITQRRIEAQGMLVVWDARGSPPLALNETLDGREVKEESFAWPRSRGRPPIVIRYAVIPPASPPR